MNLANTVDDLYGGWSVEATGEREDGDDAHCISAPISSGFTAINQPPTQLLTPRSSATGPAQQNQARRRATGTGRRRHNPAVAQYLGLGNANEPTHLEKYAPLPAVPESPPPDPARKRRRLNDSENILVRTRINVDDKDGPNQGRVSESFRVTKVTGKSALPRTKVLASEASQPPSAYASRNTSSGGRLCIDPQLDKFTYLTHETTLQNDRPRPARAITQDTVNVTQFEDQIDHQLFGLEANDCNTNGSAQFDSSSPQAQIDDSVIDHDDIFDEDINDDDLLMLTSDLADATFKSTNGVSSSLAKSSTDVEDNGQHHSPGSTANTAIISQEDISIDSSQRLLRKFVSPVTLTTRLLTATGAMDSVEARNPIVRSPFPNSVRDRSPIIGLSSCTLLRTCFRIGEAINQSSQAAKSGKHVTVELYARVLDSDRTDTKQRFTFCDLFHAKPPYIKAVYDAVIWKSVQLFEYDSRRLLQEGRTCRCIGTMKRDGKVWVMTVLNIWEATWEDIKWVEGIVNF